MIDGHLNPDLIPDAVHGRTTLPPAEAAHLLVCPRCRAEWNLVSGTASLGVKRLASFDARRVTDRVQARLASAPVRDRHNWRWPIALATAAALVLAVWYQRSDRIDSIPGTDAATAESVLHELDSLNVVQLERVLAAIPPETDHVEQLPLGDLTTDDLVRVLRSMEE